MQMKRLGLWLFLIIIIGAVFGWKAWQKQTISNDPMSTQVKGPAVILFKGDNDPGCRTIYHLVDQAAARYSQTIHFVQLEWDADNPLIKTYQVRFLPTVVFIDQHDKEVGRTIGESPAVQQKLGQTLAQLEDLLGQ
jgi:hypothetical protein